MTLLEPTSEEGVFIFKFDNSSMENFITCARKAQYHSAWGRRPVVFDAATFFGGVAHEALEIRKNHMLAPNPTWQQDQAKLIIRRFDSNPPPIDEWRTPDNLLSLITEYNKTYPVETEPFKIIPGTIEMPFSVYIGKAEVNAEVEIRPGQIVYIKYLLLYWTGRIDAIIELDGALFVDDHKTASVMGPTFFEDFNLSAQMHGYTWAARELGYPVQGLYLDVLGNRKPSKTGKAIELIRQRYYYRDSLIEEWKMDTFTSLTDFIEHMIRNYFPKGQKWCHGRFGKCEFWDVCNADPDQRVGMLFNSGSFEENTWSPLNERSTDA